MRARLRSWWQKTSKPLNAVIVTALVVLLALLVVIILGYIFNWPWTGLRERTLYDWLQLLIIPVVLALGGYLFNYTTNRNEQKATQLRAQGEREAAEKQAQAEREIALDNQHEQALQAYIDGMSALLLEKNLRKSGEDDEVRNIARVRTLTVLPRLDPVRKASVLNFLYESRLIDKGKIIVDLNGADLRGVELTEVNLSQISLTGAKLSSAKLDFAFLIEADLSYVDLSEANMTSVNLSETYMDNADLHGAFLFLADLSNTSLSDANLLKANLLKASLRGADLSGTNLSGAILAGADLRGATGITIEELEKRANSLKGATMPDGSKHA